MENQFEVTIENTDKEIVSRDVYLEKKVYFNTDMRPQMLPQNFDMTFSGIIRGRFAPYDFMNNLCYIIEKAFVLNDNCFFTASNDELKIEVIFENEENDENTIEIKLYESNNGEFVLKFTNISGSMQNFSAKFRDISELIRKNYN